MTATATKGATMAAIRSAMPEFFSMAIPSIIRALSDKAETRAMLARALTGAALERAQSGNTPALAGADSALDGIKGKAARAMVDNALSHVRAIKPRAMASCDIDAYKAWAAEQFTALSELLTPAPAPAKPKAPATNWKARAEAAEAAHAILLAYAESLRATMGANAPAMPVGAMLTPATESAPI